MRTLWRLETKEFLIAWSIAISPQSVERFFSHLKYVFFLFFQSVTGRWLNSLQSTRLSTKLVESWLTSWIDVAIFQHRWRFFDPSVVVALWCDAFIELGLYEMFLFIGCDLGFGLFFKVSNFRLRQLGMMRSLLDLNVSSLSFQRTFRHSLMRWSQSNFCAQMSCRMIFPRDTKLFKIPKQTVK